MLTKEQLEQAEVIINNTGGCGVTLANELIEMIRTLKQQNKQLVEAVKQIIETRGYDDSLWTTEWKYETVIDIADKAIQGDKS